MFSSIMAASTNASSAVRALALELKNLSDDPLEGVQSRLVNEENIFEWEVSLFGPPDTLYQGGYFKVKWTNIFYKVLIVRHVNMIWLDFSTL